MTLTQITGKGIKDGEILNADIHNSAAIARTKLANVDVVDDTSPQLGGNLSTNNNNIGFSDDDKAKFGDSDDLEIFHQSSNGNSIIRENGGGNLSLQSNGNNIHFYDSANSAMLATFVNGGANKFYHNGGLKIETTTDGVSVTGDLVTSDDVIINGGASDESVLRFRDGGAESWMLRQTNSDNILAFRRNSNNYLTLQANGNVDVANGLDVTGNITGSGNGGIGTASPTAASGETTLNIYANEYPEVHLTSSVTGTAASDGSIFTLNNDSSTIIRNLENSYIRFDTNGSNERMRITSGGTLGVGNTNPDSNFKLDVNGAARIGNTTDGIIIENSTQNPNTANASRIQRHGSTGNLHITAGTTTARNLIFGTKTSGAEIARFTSTGLCFNGDTADANALYDYEEGTWTVGNVSALGGTNTTVNTATYVKIGSIVHITLNIFTGSNNMSFGSVTLSGLPFTVKDHQGIFMGGYNNKDTSGTYINGSNIVIMSGQSTVRHLWSHFSYEIN